jgi:hypothetical protein
MPANVHRGHAEGGPRLGRAVALLCSVEIFGPTGQSLRKITAKFYRLGNYSMAISEAGRTPANKILMNQGAQRLQPRSPSHKSEVRSMKRANWFAGAGVVLALTFAAPLAGRAEEGSMNNPAVSGGAMAANPSEQAKMGISAAAPDKAAYVNQKIAEAKAQGKDVTAAQMQARMGQAALSKGLQSEADQHFDIALRSVGATPNEPATGSGEAQAPSGEAPGSAMPAPGSAMPGSSSSNPGSSN